MSSVFQQWFYRSMVQRFALIAAVLLSTNSFANSCDTHFGPGLTVGLGDKYLCRDGYVVNYDYERFSPVWMAYTLKRESVFTNAASRSGMNFRIDRDIDSDFRTRASIYSGSGYDKGHLAPAASVDYSEQALRQTFLYSNALPMLPGFNRNGFGYTGAWGALEDRVRDWVDERDRLWVVSGGLYLRDMGQLGGEIPIPSHFFKVIADPDERALTAYLLPHKENTADRLATYRIAVDCLEVLSGLDFLTRWPEAEDLENAVATSDSQWVVRDGEQGNTLCPAVEGL